MLTGTFCCVEPENGHLLSVVQLIKIKFYGSGEKREQGLLADAPNGGSLRSGYFVFATGFVLSQAFKIVIQRIKGATTWVFNLPVSNLPDCVLRDASGRRYTGPAFRHCAS